jgi:hypothetical protein
MNEFAGLRYASASGSTCAVNHPEDDPYLGRPMSSSAIRLRNEGPIGLDWMYDGDWVRKRFRTDVQAAVDSLAQRLVVIGHGCGNLDDANTPDNGLVILPSGATSYQMHAPSHIESVRGPKGDLIKPDGLSAIEVVGGRVEIWISYWNGEWLERRFYDTTSDRWGPVSAHVRSR